MHPQDIFQNISPLDHRYWLANRARFDQLRAIVSEEASVTQCVRVEAVLLQHLIRHLLPAGEERDRWIEAAGALPREVRAEEVYTEEETTRHNIRAIVNVIQRHLPPEVRHLVHLGATSVDILDTAAALRYRQVTREVVLPVLIEVERLLIKLADDTAERVSIGRTHGQHAVPITMGYALSEYVSRLGQSIGEIERRANLLCGKLAGAVGAYNATAVLHADPLRLEREVLADLGLSPGEHATQIVSPEPLLRLLLEINTAFGVLANLADDLRNLQRSEIGELSEYFAAGQVGSSTMPHKRNPWNAEHVKSLWKAFAPRAMTWFMDQISEHQRDLSNSASGRFVVEFIAGFVAAAERMRSILERLHVDERGIERNLRHGVERVLAEPLYILLAAGGVADAHEQIRLLTLSADETHTSILDAIRAQPEMWRVVCDTYRTLTGNDPELFFSDPANYIGASVERTRAICANHRARLSQLTDRITESVSTEGVTY